MLGAKLNAWPYPSEREDFSSETDLQFLSKMYAYEFAMIAIMHISKI